MSAPKRASVAMSSAHTPSYSTVPYFDGFAIRSELVGGLLRDNHFGQVITFPTRAAAGKQVHDMNARAAKAEGKS